MSDEHYLSAGLFRGSTAMVNGLRGEGPVEVAVDRLVSRCLCVGHNSALSELDQAAIDVANVLRYLDQAHVSYETAGIKNPPATRLRVSGALFQRWALKAAAGYARVKRRQLGGWRPPPAFVRAALGLDPLPDGCGLALLVREGDRIEREDRWTLWMGKRVDDVGPSGMWLGFRGWRFVLSWEVPFSEWRGMAVDGGVIPTSALMSRVSRVNFGSHKQLSMLFSWDEGYRASAEVIRLRERFRGARR